MKNNSKKERQKKLQKIIQKNPFLTDKELASKLKVSIQTIRLDRMELDIPEVRKRTKNVAQTAYDSLRSVKEGEVIGELVHLELNDKAESYLVTSEDMSLQDSKIIRGHHIFAQANSLAVAVIDAELVLTGSVDMKFINPAYIKDTLKAKAEVKEIKDKKVTVQVDTYRNHTKIFSGEFIMFIDIERGVSD